MKKHYGKNLLPFECYYDRGGVDPAPILAQVIRKKGHCFMRPLPPSKSFRAAVRFRSRIVVGVDFRYDNGQMITYLQNCAFAG